MLFPKPIRPKPKRRSRTRARIYCCGGHEPVEGAIGDLRRFVILRDSGCLLRTLDYPGHVCSGRYADMELTDDDYTLEHVPAVHGPSDVRRDDDAHCVGLCYGTNVKPPSADEREVMRRRLRDLFPACPELATMFTGDGDG